MTAATALSAALEGRYAIEREIGSGGMATVYLARDLRHDRNVALKVLRPELGAVLGVERFLAEIRVTANLQHPHLLPLFDSGEAAGLLFYVMPFVAGESLRARLQREHQLSVDEAVRIATAVASALDYAHRNNVVHRDLKPENILLHEGEPVVSDFGIALAVSNAGGARVTQTGLSLGTPAYMSPEQASGDRVIDARSDVYSLGAVTYEMLIGEPPHTGINVQQVIARVLTEHPRGVREQRPTVPAHVDAAVHHALAKLPADRPTSAREFAEELKGTRPVTSGARHAATVALAVGPRPARGRAWLPWGIAAVAVAASLWSFARGRGAATEPPPLVRFSTAPPGGLRSEFADLALSPDGRRLLISDGPQGGRKVWLRSLGEDDIAELPALAGTQAHFFSPNGATIGYVAEGKLRIAPLSGGTGTVVASVGEGPYFDAPSWGSAGTIAYARADAPGIWAVSANGGTPRQVTRPDTLKGEDDDGPSFLPDGAHFLFTRRVRDSGQVMIAGLDGSVQSLGIAGQVPRYASEHLLWVTPDGAIMASEFDASARRVTGSPVTLLTMPVPTTARGPRRTSMAASLTGVLAFVEASTRRSQVVVVDRAGSMTTLVSTPRTYNGPVLAPDGKSVAVEVSDTDGNTDVWVFDAAGTSRRITRGGRNQSVAWSPRGTELAWAEAGSGDTPSRVMRQRIDGSEPPAQVFAANGIVRPLSFNSAGDSLRVVVIAPRTPPRLVSVSLADGGTRDYVSAQGERSASVSPDGRWLVYTATEEGRAEVFVRPSGAPSPVVRVSPAGGEQPRWAPDGRSVFYRDSASMVEVGLALDGAVTVTGRKAHFADSYERSGLSPFSVGAGGRIAMLRAEDPANHVDVLANLGSLIRQRAAAARRAAGGQ